MWLKVGDIAAGTSQLNSRQQPRRALRLNCACDASRLSRRICVMRTRNNVVQKTQSRCKEDAATQFKSFRQQACLIHRHFQKSETSFTTSEVQGEAPWLDSTPAICPAEIPVPSAASRSRDPIGS